MKIVVAIVLLVLRMSTADLGGECDMVSFYQELGCTPLYQAEDSHCPEAFDCSSLHPDPTKCYLKGVPYDTDTQIPNSEMEHPCSRHCSCFSGYYGSDIMCSVIDCMSSFGWGNIKTQNCIHTQGLDSCCSGLFCAIKRDHMPKDGFTCSPRYGDPDVISKLKTCEVDGATYREGQSFYPKNTHKRCVCTAAWNGTIDDPSYCRDINCGIEVHSQHKIRDKCAPVFFENSRSCPINFICPSRTTSLIPSRNQNSGSPQCSFGNMMLSVGDKVAVDKSCTTCTCSVPPRVTCILRRNC